MPNLEAIAFLIAEILRFKQTDGQDSIDSASDSDQEYIYFMVEVYKKVYLRRRLLNKI